MVHQSIRKHAFTPSDLPNSGPNKTGAMHRYSLALSKSLSLLFITLSGSCLAPPLVSSPDVDSELFLAKLGGLARNEEANNETEEPKY